MPQRPPATPATPQPTHQPRTTPGGNALADRPAPQSALPCGRRGADPSGQTGPAPLGAPASGGAGPATAPGPGQPGAATPAASGTGSAAADAARRSFYQNYFRPEEWGLIAAFALNPTPEDELWLQRVVNRRLLEAMPHAAAAGQAAPASAAPTDDGASAPASGQAEPASVPAAGSGATTTERAPHPARGEPPAAAPGQLDGLVRLAHQLNAGTARVAALLREVRGLGADTWETPAQAAQAAARDEGPASHWLEDA